MILGAGGHGPTLDDLFRRAGVRHPQANALADPPDRARIDGSSPRALTFTQADRATSAFAARLRGLGLQADAIVGLQLPNTVESVIALLGVLGEAVMQMQCAAADEPLQQSSRERSGSSTPAFFVRSMPSAAR